MVTILDKIYIAIKLEDKILQKYANQQVFYIANPKHARENSKIIKIYICHKGKVVLIKI